MKNVFLALAVVSLLFASGCTYTGSGWDSPGVCSNMCSPGESQAAYPDCSCTGGSGGGGGALHYCRNICGVGQSQAAYPDCSCTGGSGGAAGGSLHYCRNICPVSQGQAPYPDCSCTGGSGVGGSGGAGGAYQPAGNSEGLFLGDEASPRGSEGMLLVLFSAKNGNATPYRNVVASIGRVSAYVEGEGAGWVFVSTGNDTVDFAQLENRSEEVASNRVWVGKYTRLAVEFFSMNATMRGTLEGRNVSLPANGYAFVVMEPVSASATSAVRLVFDLSKSFTTAADGSITFTPSVEVQSMRDARYLQRDDGSIDVYSGVLDLSEQVYVNAGWNSTYLVLGGNASACMRTCTQACAISYAPDCHYRCVSQCMGTPLGPAYNRCDDGTPFGYCSDRHPWLCLSPNTYIADCVACGCAFGQRCDSSTGTCGPYNQTCSDGTLAGQCIRGSPPYRCMGDLTTAPDCRDCGCPDGKRCLIDNTCGDYAD
ncbi:MAG: hypothetical protein PHF51_05035 [Candidatus ainarchaeum sp.]|nr:hypothetical protein [Candidatus ainarchaeum sp.]